MLPATPDVKKSRRTLLLLAALFLVPVAASFYLYYGAAYRPGGQVNHGELVAPARTLPSVSLATPEGSQTAPGLLRDKWTLLYVGSGACAQRCRTSLRTMRQVRLALGERMDRVQRVFLYEGRCCEQPFFFTEHTGLIAASLDTDGGGQLLRAFPDPTAALSDGRIYVVDPLGNLMMSYAPGAPPKGMIADLKRLLKLSHIG